MISTTCEADRILLVDDDCEIRELVSTYLEKNGLRVTAVLNGRHMRQALATAGPFDLIILDLMLPGEDGLMLCKDLRAGKFKTTPIIMLTARGDEADRILGLEMGADDCVPKPFAARELLARVKSVLRRARMLPPNMQTTNEARYLAFSDWRLDTVERILLDKEGMVVSLSGAEYRVLRVLADHPQKVLTRDQILSFTQGRESDIFERSIDSMISRLRKCLGEGARESRYIKTVHGEGYVFAVQVESQEE